MPCAEVLAWQCPVASAIRQAWLISQFEIRGGNADKLNKQQVLGPQEGDRNHRKAEGQQDRVRRRANRCSLESPLPADFFSPYSRDYFEATLKRPYQAPGIVLTLSQMLLPLTEKWNA